MFPIAFALCATALLACSFNATATNITNTAGKVYSNVELVRREPDGITLRHDGGGLSKVYFRELPKEIRDKYEPEKVVEAFLKQQEQKALQLQQRKREQAAIRARKEAEKIDSSTKETHIFEAEVVDKSETISTPIIPVIERSIFGVNLGETMSSLDKKCRRARVSVDKSWNYTDNDHPGKIIVITGALNSNPSIKETHLSVFENRVYGVQLFFEDGSEANYEVLKQSLGNKYGEDQGGPFDEIESKSTFYTSFDGQPVSIVLNHDTGIMTDDTLSITYTYDALTFLAMKEFTRRKASKVEDDL